MAVTGPDTDAVITLSRLLIVVAQAHHTNPSTASGAEKRVGGSGVKKKRLACELAC